MKHSIIRPACIALAAFALLGAAAGSQPGSKATVKPGAKTTVKPGARETVKPSPRPSPGQSPSPTPSPRPTEAATPSPTPEAPPLDGRIPRSLRGKARVGYMLRFWKDLAGPDLGQFAYEHMIGRTLHAHAGGLTLPLAVLSALPELFPERFRDPGFADFGFLPDPDDPDGMPVGLKTGGTVPRFAGLSCAACHSGAIHGRTVSGAANHALRYGDFLNAVDDAIDDPGLTLEAVGPAAQRRLGALPLADVEELRRWLADRPKRRSQAEREAAASWGAGRASYLPGGLPARIPPIWPAGDRLMTDGAWTDRAERDRYALWRLGVPYQGVRTPEAARLIRALGHHVKSLAAPPASPADRALVRLGGEVFKRDCASCHDRPGDLLLVEQVGTDDKLLREASVFDRVALRFQGFDGVDVRFWPMVKIPGLASLGSRRLLLHNGSVQSLEDMLAPSRRPPIIMHGGTPFDTRLPGHSNRGHDFGADLEPDERAGLLAYLRSR